jgi:trk system potassium uptake protein
VFVLIVGGGRIGSHLASLLLGLGHDVRVVEGRGEALERLHRELPTEVIFQGDGTDPEVLLAAGVNRAQVLVAAGADDSDNLVAASLARHEYGVRRVIGRVNNPRNAGLYSEDLGVDVAVNQADIIARLIQEEMSLGDMMTLLKVRRGRYSFVEEKIYPGAHAVGLAIKDLPLPANCTISGILRRGEMLLPRGGTVLEEGDEVLALVDDEARPGLEKLLGRPEEAST